MFVNERHIIYTLLKYQYNYKINYIIQLNVKWYNFFYDLLVHLIIKQHIDLTICKSNKIMIKINIFYTIKHHS